MHLYTKEKRRKTALPYNRTIYTLIWYADLGPGNGVGRILAAL